MDRGAKLTNDPDKFHQAPRPSPGEMVGYIRICPERDGKCPHGVMCPYTKDRYNCDIEASRTALNQNGRAHHG